MKYVFGPVPSRRLGKSLGIDLIPAKTCTYNCIYCQVGKTTDLRVERALFIDLESMYKELAEALKTSKPDYITLSGSGEPTLCKNLSEIIHRIKEIAPEIPIALITNGSLFHMKEVRNEILDVDVILPTLSACDEKIHSKIHRPHETCSNKLLIEGLKKLREDYKGKIWLEVFIIRGINDNLELIQKIAKVCKEIKPDRIQLNTSVRPSTENITQVSKDFLESICDLFTPKAEVIADFKKEEGSGNTSEEIILSYLKRRPGTLEDLSTSLNINPLELKKHINKLLDQKIIEEYELADEVYYKIR